MKVFVECPNRHRFRCDESHLGRKVLCPREGCGARFRLYPMAGTQPAQDDEPVLRACPKCSAPTFPEAELCVNCGWSFVSGSRVETEIVKPGRSDASPSDPRSDEFRRLEKQMDWVGAIWAAIIMFSFAVFAMYMSSIEQPEYWLVRRFRWVFAILGWQTTWIVFGFFGSITGFMAIIQLVRQGKLENDIFELDDLD